jgi:hypothetical protein
MTDHGSSRATTRFARRGWTVAVAAFDFDPELLRNADVRERDAVSPAIRAVLVGGWAGKPAV